MDFELELGFSGQNLTILLEFGPTCLDLGRFAKFWAILLGFWLFGRIWVRKGLKGDKALRMRWGTNGQMDGRMDGRTDRQTVGQTDSPCVL